MRTEEKWSLSADGIPSLAMPGKARLGYNIISSEIENITAGYYDCSLPCCESDHATDNSFLSEPRPSIYRKNRTLSTTLRKWRGCTAANSDLLSQCFDWSVTNFKIRTEWECDLLTIRTRLDQPENMLLGLVLSLPQSDLFYLIVDDWTWENLPARAAVPWLETVEYSWGPRKRREIAWDCKNGEKLGEWGVVGGGQSVQYLDTSSTRMSGD